MHDQPGFSVNGKFYPQPRPFRIGDIILITEVTGMDFLDFAQALEDDARESDPVIISGLVAASVYQQNPRWTRSRAMQYVNSIVWQNIEFHSGVEDAAPEGPDSPPSMAATAASTSISPATSEPSPVTP